MNKPMTTTYSMWRMFRNCRKACEYRYLRNLVPLEKDHNMAFGSVIHDCLEIWHGERELEKVIAHIDRTYANRIPGHGVTSIVTGSTTTLTEGRPNARLGDQCGCGAVIVSGSPNALLS